ncbi:hypothetical protein AVEN_104734-1 [Araneus ventricosus]|uniref:HAT C-terminal dimerisation domain-containing protein n=1 Tax=Araneus ventricosus TaxID=182803 RepID=A0A4Y2SDF4_ARAVE|nr:hypothetical protein AVEN_48281-1 [Araneus ventricosus]GBN85951.1 hypothetical protein AVEN_104734-1 [Araneus ventricosus]
MDGPNVIKKLLKDLQAQIKEQPTDPEILNIGSCGLHAINVAFKAGAVVTQWKILEFHRALYYLFNKSPARRALYSFYSGSSLFPKKFCAIRWLENSDVANRALDMLPHLKSYVEAVEKNKEAPCSNSYNLIKEAIQDKLLPAKLTFFRSVACEFEGFLREYQTDAPLIPFLFSDLSVLLQGLMERFVGKDVLVKNSIMEIDLNDIKSLCTDKQMDLGISTLSCIRKSQVPEKDATAFRKECRQFLLKCVQKMRECSPLIYSLTKAVSCFDPSIALKEKIFSRRLVSLLLILTEKNWVDGIVADRAKRQLIDVCSRPHIIHSLQQYKRQYESIDKFWFNLLTTEGACNDAIKVLKIVMVLSHGNASVERGFSINSDCLWENMKEDSLIARRRVFDYIASVGGLSNIEISKKMIHYVHNARARYSEANEARRKEQQHKATLLKRKKETTLQLKDLEAKKLKIQQQAQRQKDVIDEEISALKILQNNLT